jgi:hypothetical protein
MAATPQGKIPHANAQQNAKFRYPACAFEGESKLHMAREEFPGRLCLEINASMPYIPSRDQHLILASRVYGSPSNGFWLAPSLH